MSAAGLAISGSILAACGDDDDDDAGAGSGEPGETATISTQLSWLMNVEFGGHWIADDQGYFEEQGIEPEWITGGPNAPRSEGVVTAGQADIGMSSFMETTVRAIMEGAPIKMVAAFFQHSPLALMSTESRPIRTADDMVGKRLGGPPFLEPNIDSLFRANGLDVDYTFVPVGGTEPDPLLNDEIDALYVFITNQPLIYEEVAGEEPVLLLDSENNFDAYSSIYFARTEDIEGDARDSLVRYFRGLAKGWEHNLDDPELGAQLSVEEFGSDLGLDLEQQIAENKIQNTLTASEPAQEKGVLSLDQAFIEESAFRSFEAAGMTDLPDVNDIADFSLLEEVFEDQLRFYLDQDVDLAELASTRLES
jgi:ABC-type nitrate/sulfonate/bicarbonate transport system substrate-binding protein